MTTTVKFKQNDTLPNLDVTLVDDDDAAINVSGATIRFLMRAPGSTTTKVDAAGSIVSAADGQVRYSWAAGDLDTVGSYDAEFQVTFGSGGVRTFPTDGYLRIVVRDDLG